MVRKIFEYGLMLGIIFAMTNCDKLIYDQHEEAKEGDLPAVFLSVTRGGAAKLRAADANNPTINEDYDDWEDRVHDLAMLVFDSNTKEKIAEYFDENIPSTRVNETFVIKLTPGLRDFYFVANMPIDDLEAISNKDEMDNYMKGLFTLDSDLYATATETKGFPMSRKYPNQVIITGGTVYQPAPFKPEGAFGPEDRVYLIRVVAKLEVNIAADEVDNIKRITLINSVNDYNFIEIGPSVLDYTNSNVYHGDVPVNRVGATNTFICYMPESIMKTPQWSDDQTAHKPINYFEIETTADKVYQIPIISLLDEDFDFPNGYLDYAMNLTGEHRYQYNIYRNRRYLYEVKNLSNIEVEYKVAKWTEVPTTLFMGYGYNVIIDENGNITIENTIDDCMPHKVTLKALNGAYFGTPGNDIIEYGYFSSTDPNYAPHKTKAGYSESFDALNSESVNTGQAYLEIYYNLDGEGNPILMKTYTK